MNRLLAGATILAVAFLGVVGVGGSASAQSCSGSTCDLGGGLRLQIGNGLPLPATFQPQPTNQLIQRGIGAVAAVPDATIMQGDTAPRSLMLAPAQLRYDGPPIGVPVLAVNPQVLQVLSDLEFTFPADVLAPGRPVGTVTFSAGGRAGPDVVSWCVGSPVPTASFNPGCIGPNTTASGGAPVSHGFIRYTATANQFGGNAIARTGGGTARVFFNAANLTAMQLPCSGPACFFGVQLVTPPETQAGGATFATPPNATPAVNNPTGLLTGSVGANGTILAIGDPITDDNGVNLTFPGQDATSWGFPWTTGMLTQTNTAVPPGAATSMFVRTGADGRNAAGSGLVTMVAGTISARNLSGPNANRFWLTLEIPEPGVLLGSTAAFGALFGLHHMMGRRRRD